MKNHKSVWVTWENQRRSIVLAEEFGCKLFIYNRNFKLKIIRYILASLTTTCFIIKQRPSVVFGQNPSIILAALLTLLKRVFKYRLIVDRHSNFMFEMNKNIIYKLFTLISDYTIKKSDYTIVTNEFLKINYIDKVGGKGVVLPDKIPDMAVKNRINIQDKKTVFFITSFSRDEPISEFFDAIKDLSDEYYFYVSGNFKKIDENLNRFGENYELTGFVGENEFKSILNSVDVVMVFTKNEHTLTCGAYEGVAAEKPLVLSDTSTIKEYFKQGAIYCDLSASGIRSGILECFENYLILEKEIRILKRELNESWNEKFKIVNELIFCETSSHALCQ